MKTVLITHFALLLFLIPGMSWAQVVAISGYVNDGSSGKALENVSVFEKNSGIGTITNQNGFYKLILQEGEVDLAISNGGFKSVQHHVKAIADTTLVVSLQPVINGKDKQKKDDQVRAELKVEKKNVRKGFLFF
ncbi:carboxypeptidase-like regulatory domain-containing protein [Draconibacterium sp. IB214405]|uniref:carboxypeptidase-like regulatory domain-containing protein n=1 Tax=Draconibacterium sp. IB214405 TaxID=3097352 RepID=UPI002A125688|nr:carboxypeptidase-like regulatory domain-containing protein [Draconibacterium sp. IB214405]MDX8340612.1 carboxypeptidase-like regulatory domain-containing protein [Draconibacterium sp. IB214405]